MTAHNKMKSVYQAKRIVINTNPDAAIESGAGRTTLVESAFFLPEEKSLQINAGNSDGKVLDFLTHAVTRNSADLRSHVQRINLNIRSVDPDGLYGALLDLFIALTNKGQPLRERMLEHSKPILDEDRYQFLFQHLNRGVTAIDAAPPSGSSMLVKGVVSTSQLIRKLDNKKNSERDPLDEAHEYLEYGQIEEAQQVLEKAILKSPARTELYDDLINIYRGTNASESFRMMQMQLNANAASTPDSWDELENFFAESV